MKIEIPSYVCEKKSWGYAIPLERAIKIITKDGITEDEKHELKRLVDGPLSHNSFELNLRHRVDDYDWVYDEYRSPPLKLDDSTVQLWPEQWAQFRVDIYDLLSLDNLMIGLRELTEKEAKEVEQKKIESEYRKHIRDEGWRTKLPFNLIYLNALSNISCEHFPKEPSDESERYTIADFSEFRIHHQTTSGNISLRIPLIAKQEQFIREVAAHQNIFSFYCRKLTDKEMLRWAGAYNISAVKYERESFEKLKKELK
ncbi:MAG: hypothetical protein PHD31_02530 [Candidatus Pacebacteria bacterium]|nr:hypothetical protein [Candidatus Paceibacterota bacterium]